MIVFKGRTVLVADTNVQDFPSSKRLVSVAKSCVRVSRLFGFDPKVAFYLIQLLENQYQEIPSMSGKLLNY